MSIRKLKAFAYHCDATGCDVETFSILGQDDTATGFHGNALKVHEVGRTNGFEWYACKAEHIQSAVENAIKVGMQS